MDWFLNFTKRYAPAFSLRKNLRRLFFRPIDNIGIIDGVRALSVITLMIGHLVMWLQFFYPDKKSFLLELPPMLQYLMNGSILGVNIFFVISGYLIGKILLLEFKKTQTIQITRFYKRRFLRLMPVYWLSLFIVFLIGFPNSHFVWSNLLYINNYVPYKQQFMGWTWSLAIEEQFYFIFPLLLVWFFKTKNIKQNPKKFVLTLYLLAAGIGLFVIYYFQLSIPLLDHSSDMFLKFARFYYAMPYVSFVPLFSGVVLAYITFFNGRSIVIMRYMQKKKIASLLAYASIICIFLLFLIGNDQIRYAIHVKQFFIPFIVLFFSASIVYLIFYVTKSRGLLARWLAGKLSWRGFYFIAQISYSVYIFHLVVIPLVYFGILKLFPAMQYLALLLIGGAVSIVLTGIIATLAFLFVERPGMNMREL